LKNKKNIVVFIDWFTPGYKAGGPVRSCVNLIEHLKDEYNFYVITGDTDYGEALPYKNIATNKWNVLEEGVNVYYFSRKHLSLSSIRKLLSEIPNIHKYYLNSVFSYFYTFIPLVILKNKNNVILAPRGMFAKSALSIKPLKKNIFIAMVKMLGLYKNISFQATSANEENDIKSVIGENAKISLAPNLSRKVQLVTQTRKKKAGAVRLLYLARTSPEKNLLYALEVLKSITNNIVFDLYGVINDEDYWEKCKKVIDLLPQHIVVTYKGLVKSEAIYSVISEYDFLFLPTLGENFGHSIIESFSVGCPVIISDKTPWRNLQQKNIGWDLPLEDKNGFATVIEQCARMNSEEYDQMSERAVSFASSYIYGEESLQLNKKLFE
jgi:glycosyltransferase involved in cell wall biosynthesis